MKRSGQIVARSGLCLSAMLSDNSIVFDKCDVHDANQVSSSQFNEFILIGASDSLVLISGL